MDSFELYLADSADKAECQGHDLMLIAYLVNEAQARYRQTGAQDGDAVRELQRMTREPAR